MGTTRRVVGGFVVVLSASSLGLTACGSSSSSSASSDSATFCSDARKIASANSSQSATDDTASLYAKLANESSGSVKSDLLYLADAESKVIHGNVSQLDETKVDATSKRISAYLQKTCGNE